MQFCKKIRVTAVNICNTKKIFKGVKNVYYIGLHAFNVHVIRMFTSYYLHRLNNQHQKKYRKGKKIEKQLQTVKTKPNTNSRCE